MATKHHISHADKLYWGDAYFAPAFATNERPGTEITPIVKIALGSPAALDADGIVAAATSTELPNNTTITYTTADDGVSPFDNSATPAPATVAVQDGSKSVWTLGVPRNLTMDVAHGTSILAMSCTITGYDVYGQKMVETLSVTATGTSKSAAGKKAFKHIYSIAFTSASNATTNTVDLGWGDVLGLPVVLGAKSDLMQTWFNEVLEGTVPTVVVQDANTATATTGDVRGTIDLNSALDGSRVAVYIRPDPTSKESLYGVAQYAG